MFKVERVKLTPIQTGRPRETREQYLYASAYNRGVINLTGFSAKAAKLARTENLLNDEQRNKRIAHDNRSRPSRDQKTVWTKPATPMADKLRAK